MALERHAAALRRCRACPLVESAPVVVVPPEPSGVVLVGQAPGPREPVRGRFFAHTAGTRLFAWLGEIGVGEEAFRRRVWIAATMRCFPGRALPGGDRAPSPEEIARCAPYLDREFELLDTSVVIAVGTLSIAHLLGPGPLAERVGRSFEVERAGRRLTVVPLPHPSGRSTWFNRPENRARLRRGLRRLAATPAFRQAFPEAAAPAMRS